MDSLDKVEQRQGIQLAGISHLLQYNAALNKFYNLKVINLETVRNLAFHSKLSANLELLGRSILNNPICTVQKCEKAISVKIAGNGSVNVTREIINLQPTMKYLLECELSSSTMVSSLHGLQGTKQGRQFLVNNQLITPEDLSNSSFVN